jgi:Phage T7 capsid assembly protein
MADVNLPQAPYNPTTGPNDAAMLALAQQVEASNAAGIAAGKAAAAGASAASAPAPVAAAPMQPAQNVGTPAQAPTNGLEIKPVEAAPKPPILGKFQTQADLEKAYTELETKLGGGKPAEAPKAITDTELTEYSSEFANSGALSEASYAKLEARGLNKTVVNAYIAGQKAATEQALQSVYQTVGGAESYKAASEWAAGALPPAELDAYNKTMRSGDMGAIQSAVAGLHARYTVAGGKAPNAPQQRVYGSQAPANNGVQAFTSADEVALAMAHPAYKSNPAYRELVARRMAATK